MKGRGRGAFQRIEMFTRGSTDSSQFQLKYLRVTVRPHHNCRTNTTRLRAPKYFANFAKAHRFPGSPKPSFSPILPLPSRNEVPRQQGNNFKSTKFASVLPTWTLEDALKLAKETRLPGTETCRGGEGGEAAGLPYPWIWSNPPLPRAPFTGRHVPLPRRPSQIRPARPPAPLARRPANHSRSTQPSGLQGAGAGRPRAFPEPAPRGRGPGAPLVRLPRGSEWRRPAPQGHLRVRARGKPAEPRRRQPLAVGKRKMNLPPNGPVGGGCGRGVPGGRAGPGAAAAATAVPSAPLFPFREDPGKAEPGNQEVPRRDTSCRRYGNGPPPPRAARPGPRLRAAGPARLTGRRQPSPLRPRPPPSWRGPGGPFPAARARCSRVFPLAAGARCQGRRVLAPLPGKRGQERPPGPRGREREKGPRWDWRARTWSGASSNCTKTTGFSWCPLAGRGMAETRGEVSRAVAESHGLCSQIASCFVSGSTTHQLSELGHFNFLYASVYL